MKFYYDGKNSKLKVAVFRANVICETPEFYMNIKAVDDFDLDNSTPVIIADMIKYHPGLIFVKSYWKPISKANAYFTKSRPKDINMNTAKLKRSINSIVNTLIHEGTHCVDHAQESAYFGHEGNSRHGKEDTAPYKIGSIAQEMAERIWPTPKRLSRWQRFKRFLRRIL